MCRSRCVTRVHAEKCVVTVVLLRLANVASMTQSERAAAARGKTCVLYQTCVSRLYPAYLATPLDAGCRVTYAPLADITARAHARTSRHKESVEQTGRESASAYTHAYARVARHSSHAQLRRCRTVPSRPVPPARTPPRLARTKAINTRITDQ